eukprot:3145-Heterococcus_DN1.PRE.1
MCCEAQPCCTLRDARSQSLTAKNTTASGCTSLDRNWILDCGSAGESMSSRRVFLKVICVGDSGVGKTALLHQAVQHKFSTSYRATIGADFLQYDIEVEGRPVSIQIWDTAGQERFSSLGVAFYRGADAALLVYDITNARSFEQLGSWREEFLHQANPINPDSFPFVCIGNKMDKESERRVSKSTAQEWCKHSSLTIQALSDPRSIRRADKCCTCCVSLLSLQTIPYFETSAKSGDSVHEAFVEVARLALLNSKHAGVDANMPYDRVTLITSENQTLYAAMLATTAAIREPA